MSGFGDAIKALRTVLLIEDDVRRLKEDAVLQAERLSKLASAHGDLRDRVSRLEGVIEGAAMAAARQRRIEDQA